MAKQGNGIRRTTAEKLIPILVERARQYNAADGTEWIDRMAIFGSYLGDKTVLGDLDVMVWLSPRYPIGPDRDAAVERSIERSPEYLSPIARMLHSGAEWVRALRGKNPAVSIHDAARDAIIAQTTPLQDIFHRM